MTRTPLAVAILLVGVPLADAHRAGAQEHPPQPWERRTRPTVSIGADALLSTVGATGGGQRIHDGGGFDVHAGINVSAFSLAGGYQRTTHDFTGATARASYAGPYVEPRVSLDLGGSSFVPYVAGRVGRLTQKVPVTSTTLAGSRTGTLLGVGGGVQVALTQRVGLDVGALWSTVRFGNAAIVPVSGPYVGGNGDGAMLKAGVRLTP